MKSKTSFFKATALRKDITRFAPVWAVYAVATVLVMLSSMNGLAQGRIVANLDDSLKGMMPVIIMIYAAVCAQVLFGDLFNTRLCNGLHALPLRREVWFFSHIAAGLLFFIVPNVIAALALIPLLGSYWLAALLWLGAVILQYLFFFGTAVFACLCVGSRFAMLTVYGIVNFLSMLAAWFVQMILLPHLRGIELDFDLFITLCPIVSMLSIDYDRSYFTAGSISHGHPFGDAGWGYLAAAAGAGLVLIVLALLLYRRRRLETAGDFVAVRPLAPVVLVLYTLCIGVLFTEVQTIFFSYGTGAEATYWIFLAVGLTLGYFTGHMLLKRTAKIFRLRVFLGYAALTAVIAGSILLARLDVLGIVRWTPAKWQVEQAAIRTTGYYYRDGIRTSDPEEIAQIIAIHKDLMDRTDDANHGDLPLITLDITYSLKGGTSVSRSYSFCPYASPLRESLRQLYNTPEHVLGYSGDWAHFAASVLYIDFGQYGSLIDFDNQPQALQSLLDAIKADFDEGNMAQVWWLHGDKGSLTSIRIIGAGSVDYYLDIYESAVHTVKWMHDHFIEIPVA